MLSEHGACPLHARTLLRAARPAEVPVPAPGAFHSGTLDLGDLPRARAASRQGRTGKWSAGSLKTDHDDMGSRVRTRDESTNAGPARSALRRPFLAQPPVRTDEARGSGSKPSSTEFGRGWLLDVVLARERRQQRADDSAAPDGSRPGRGSNLARMTATPVRCVRWASSGHGRPRSGGVACGLRQNAARRRGAADRGRRGGRGHALAAIVDAPKTRCASTRPPAGGPDRDRCAACAEGRLQMRRVLFPSPGAVRWRSAFKMNRNVAIAPSAGGPHRSSATPIVCRSEEAQPSTERIHPVTLAP